MRKKIVSAAGALLMAAMMVCSVFAEGTDDLKTIGTREEGAYQIALTNATGRDISAFKIRTNDVLEFSENLMEEGDIFAADETRFFFYKTEDVPELSDEEETEPEEQDEEVSDAEVSDAEEDAADEEQQIGYDLQITFADDQSTAEINAFPFDHIAEGQICAADGVAFLIYTDTETFEEVNTKEFALSILQQAQDAIRQAEEAAAAAAAQPSYSEPSYSAPSYTAPSYTAPSYTAPSYTAPAGGGDDTCIEDGLFW